VQHLLRAKRKACSARREIVACERAPKSLVEPHLLKVIAGIGANGASYDLRATGVILKETRQIVNLCKS
jgi:hypothetical protein